MAKQQRTSNEPPARPTKRATILEAARDLFLEHGFASTSVDAVTEASGVSKPTVYSHFATKEALLEAVVRGEVERVNVPIEFHPTGNAKQDLEQVAYTLTRMALSPETLAWDRMMAGESRRKPELGKVFFECGPGQMVTVLAQFFEAISKTGNIEITDPVQASEFFFGMVVGLPLLRAQLTGETESPTATRARCREIADRFLRAYLPQSKTKKP